MREAFLDHCAQDFVQLKQQNRTGGSLKGNTHDLLQTVPRLSPSTQVFCKFLE